jgi:hypothetical protein
MEWTADGEHLYYSVLSPNADDPANGTYRYDRDDGSTRQVLSPSPELGPPAVLQVNATDTHVLIWYPYAAGSFERDKPLYWLFGVGTGDVTPLEVPVPDDAGIGWIAAATFSPDGRSLLTATRNTTPDAQLWVTDLESGEQTLLVESLPGAMVMEYSLTQSWTASGRIFVPANIGSGTLLTVEAVDMPEVGTPIVGPVDPAATPATDWAGVAVGEVLLVTSPGVPVHASPSATAPAVLLLDQGAEVRVIGPPEEAEGILWIPVQNEATRTIGFVRAEFLSAENP